MAWELNRLNLVCGLLALVGIAHFFYAVVAAMSVFPGGYLNTENFLSDLGRSVTLNNQDNSASAAIFNRAAILLGSTLVLFFAVMPAVLEKRAWLVRGFGVMSALGLIGIGLTPYDLYFAEHMLALGLWMIPLLGTVIVFAVSVDLDHKGSAILLLCTLLVVFAAGAYVFASDFNGHVVFQKVLVVAAAVWFCLVLVLVSISTVQSIPSTRLLAEKQARQYLKMIQHGHRRR